MLLFLLILHSIVLCWAQNQTIWTELATLTPFLASHLESNIELHTLLNQIDKNFTFFLPTDAAINASIQTGALNFSLSANHTYSAFNFLLLNGLYSSQGLVAKQSFPFTTLDTSTTLLMTATNTTSIQLKSGSDQANVIKTDYNCINGVIHLIDHFLQPPATPLDTISKLPETEYLEGILKSLNLSDILSKPNRTIFAATNEAWALTNSSLLPFGTLVHNLRWMSVQGIYYSHDLLLANTTMTTDFRKTALSFVPFPVASIIGQTDQDVAHVVKMDVTTSMGVIHLVDKVLTADIVASSASSSSSSNSNSADSKMNDGDDGDTKGNGREGKARSPVFISNTSSVINVNWVFIYLCLGFLYLLLLFL